jgi:hypothetical protein
MSPYLVHGLEVALRLWTECAHSLYASHGVALHESIPGAWPGLEVVLRLWAECTHSLYVSHGITLHESLPGALHGSYLNALSPGMSVMELLCMIPYLVHCMEVTMRLWTECTQSLNVSNGIALHDSLPGALHGSCSEVVD